MSSAVSKIEVVHVSKFYGDYCALKDVSFQLEPGKVTALLGPNGAGKSTTLQLLLGLKKPSSGQIHRRAPIGYASQEIGYPLHLRVAEVLRLVAIHYDSLAEIESLSERFDLGRLRSRLTGSLSGGERRRLAIACAFLAKPEVLILDEPTTGLDIESRHCLWLELRKFRDQGGSVLLSTHDLNEVAQLADDALLIERGELLFSGPLRKILAEIRAKTIFFEADMGEISETTLDSDAFVRGLVNRGENFRNLRIREATLEEAFMELRRSRQ